MARSVFIAVLLLLVSVAAESQGQLFRRLSRSIGNTSQRSTSGRYCQNPGCSMCNRLFGLMPGYAYVNGRITYVGRSAKATEQPPKQAIESTPQPIVEMMLFLAGLTKDDVLLDPGCGDGRFLITAVKQYDCKAIGVEIDEKTADAADTAVKEAGVDSQVLVVRGDATKHQLGIATAVTLYLFPVAIKEMSPNWPNARVVVSYQHPLDLPGGVNRKLDVPLNGETHTIFFWTKEKP